jgi:hypothetical protein
VEGALPEPESGQQEEMPLPADITGISRNAPEAIAAAAVPADDPTAAAIARTKRKLDMIDQLLGASPQ